MKAAWTFCAVLEFGTVLSPLIAAAAIAATGLRERSRNQTSARFAQLGAIASACCALGVLISGLGVDLSTEAPLSLGTWFVNGPGDLLRVRFRLEFDALTAALAVALAIATWSLFAVRRVLPEDAHADDRWMPLGGSLLLFASIGVAAASTSLTELFVFWELGTAAVYVMLSLSAKTAPEANAARKLVLVLSVADAFLLSAVLILAAGFGTLDFRVLFGRSEIWARAASQRAALVDLIGLCVLGACVGRCALVPFLGWIGDLGGRRAALAALIEAIALLPCGAVLVIRCFPLLSSATVVVPLAAFVGGSSAFCAAVCAVAAADFRRTASFACASVMGIVLLGLSTGNSASPAIALGLTAAFAPLATLIVLAGSPFGRTAVHRLSIVAIVSLFSGLCGQAWLVGGALHTLFSEAGRDSPSLLLAVLLAGCGQYFATFALMRRMGSSGTVHEGAAWNSFDAFSAAEHEETPAQADLPPGPAMILACAGIAAALLATALNLAAFPQVSAGRMLAFALLGLVPGVGGMVAGFRSAGAGEPVFPSASANGLLMRLGRSGFYFDTFLFLFVLLPLRGIAGFARFVDWALIDTLASGGPASLFESAASFFGPLQKRGVIFYLFSAMLGTLVLSLLMIWLRG